jgi:hypothetical protein
VDAYFSRMDAWTYPLQDAIRRMLREGIDEERPIAELRSLPRMCR